MGYVSSLKDKLLFQRLNTDVSCQLEIPDRTFSEILSLGRSKKNMAGLKQKIYSSQKKKHLACRLEVNFTVRDVHNESEV